MRAFTDYCMHLLSCSMLYRLLKNTCLNCHQFKMGRQEVRASKCLGLISHSVQLTCLIPGSEAMMLARDMGR